MVVIVVPPNLGWQVRRTLVVVFMAVELSSLEQF